MKSRVPSRAQPTAIVDDPCYWYFFTELLLSFDLTPDEFCHCLASANIRPDLHDRIMKIPAIDHDLETRALAFFDAFSREEMEDVVSEALRLRSFSYSTPSSRLEMGTHMIRAVATPLVSVEQKGLFVADFMDSVINRIIQSE